jgi:hypothetical protein
MPNEKKLDQAKIDEIILKIFSLLNEQKVSPEEGFVVAEEILMSSMEKFAKIHGVSVDEIHAKLVDHISGGLRASSGHKKQPTYVVGQNRGWIGNPKTQTENN